MKIRYASNKDLRQLSELFQQEIEQQQSHAGYYELHQDFDWPAYVKDKLDGRKSSFFVSENEGVLVGFIYMSIRDYPARSKNRSILRRLLLRSGRRALNPLKPMRWGVIEDYYVDPAFRQQGIATQLIKNAMCWFKENKVSRIELSLLTNNTESKALAKKFGFRSFRHSLYKVIDLPVMETAEKATASGMEQ